MPDRVSTADESGPAAFPLGLDGAARPRQPAACASEAEILEGAGRWWVLHTRSRNEKRVAEELDSYGVPHYLPLVPVEHSYAKRRATFEIPLFTGYVFLRGEHDECDRARRTNRVASILLVRDQDGFRRELAHVFRVVSRRAYVQLFPAIRVGQRCRVSSGPLRGVEGVVIREGQRCRMYLSVTMLGQSAVVEIDAALLEPAA